MVLELSTVSGKSKGGEEDDLFEENQDELCHVCGPCGYIDEFVCCV